MPTIMKPKVIFFIALNLLVLLSIPAINIFEAPNRGAINWKSKAFLYNMDFAPRWAAAVLYPLGISTDPQQVIIGKDGWLYLGDMYLSTLSEDRRAASETDLALGKQIGAAMSAWDAYLTGKGVKVFRLMIGPNKGTIYPEHLPEWARPAPHNPTDALISQDSGNRFVDLRAPLLEAKNTLPHALYYKTDTHWNAVGAAVGFRAFAQTIAISDPTIVWPSPTAYAIVETPLRKGGDLANFLRLSASLDDEEPVISASTLAITTTTIDFDSKKTLTKGANLPIKAPNTPILVESKGALNDKKVLWLRDSFGNSLSPLMAATFKNVIQLHWSEALKPGGRFQQLVDEWKPDYVFVTVVERAARSEFFTYFPPAAFLPDTGEFKTVSSAIPISDNQLIHGESGNDYEITGNDALINFSLSKTVTPTDVDYLSLNLSCADGTQAIPMQFFWLDETRPAFDEEHSVKFTAPTGRHLLDLRTLPKWSSASNVKLIRLDFEANKSCFHVRIEPPTLDARTGRETKADKLID